MTEIYERVIKTFTEYKGVSISDVMGVCNKRDVTQTRFMIYAYLHNECGLSGSRMSEYFGRSRVNILRGIRTLKGWMRYHPPIKAEYFEVVKKMEEAD